MLGAMQGKMKSERRRMSWIEVEASIQMKNQNLSNNKNPKRMKNPNLEGHQVSQAARRKLEKRKCDSINIYKNLSLLPLLKSSKNSNKNYLSALLTIPNCLQNHISAF